MYMQFTYMAFTGDLHQIKGVSPSKITWFFAYLSYGTQFDTQRRLHVVYIEDRTQVDI